MSALVPINHPQALPRLRRVGVDEVYAGFHDEGWARRFGDAELNRMSGFGREANPFDLPGLCDQLSRARDLGMRAYVCFNAASYTADQERFVADRYLGALAQAGAHGVIVSGQGLVPAARRAGLQVTVSTIAGVYNARLARHYRDRGATRVIVPRDLSSDEIAGIVRAVPQLEYEVFLMRNGCLFSDSHCLGCHRAGWPSLCTSLREGEPSIRLGGACGRDDEGFLRRACENERLLNQVYHRRTCGLCALWRFEQLGVDAYKVVGRGDDLDDLCHDAALVVRNVRLARTCATERDYLASMELPRDPSTLCANRGLSCYYPELSRSVRQVAARDLPAGPRERTVTPAGVR